jgi:hypothetical protein
MQQLSRTKLLVYNTPPLPAPLNLQIRPGSRKAIRNHKPRHQKPQVAAKPNPSTWRSEKDVRLSRTPNPLLWRKDRVFSLPRPQMYPLLYKQPLLSYRLSAQLDPTLAPSSHTQQMRKLQKDRRSRASNPPSRDQKTGKTDGEGKSRARGKKKPGTS